MTRFAERDPAVKALVEQALSVLPQEIGCDSCAEYLAAYADYRLRGTIPPDSLKAVGEHLDRCDACLAEFGLLLDAVLGADDHLVNRVGPDIVSLSGRRQRER